MSYLLPGRFESVKRKDSCSPSKLGNLVSDSLESQNSRSASAPRFRSLGKSLSGRH